jgi:dienelactone hydrolase
MKKIIFFCGVFALVLSFNLFAQCDGHSQSFDTLDPIDYSAWSVGAHVFRPPSISGVTKKIPIVFILPPIIGANDLDRALALRLCTSGIGAYILEVIKKPSFAEEVWNLDSHYYAIQRVHTGVRTAIESLQKETDISGSFGVMGASLGALESAYIAGSEPAIKASVLLAGGGNLAGILAYSTQTNIKKIREARMTTFALPDQASYQKLLAPFIQADPLDYAKNIRSGSMMMFITLQDTEVPSRFQQEFRKAVSQPKVIEINAGHVDGIVEAGTLHAEEIVHFFQKQL